MSYAEEKARQKAFDKAVSRIVKARAAVEASKLDKTPANRVLDHLSDHLNRVWQGCRAGSCGIVEFCAALKDWEDASVAQVEGMKAQ